VKYASFFYGKNSGDTLKPWERDFVIKEEDEKKRSEEYG